MPGGHDRVVNFHRALEDVEGVCGSDDAPAAQALDVLSSLVDKSLVLKVKEDANDVASYRLHETMREYAGLKVQAAGEQDAVELRCADYYRANARGLRRKPATSSWSGWTG